MNGYWMHAVVTAVALLIIGITFWGIYVAPSINSNEPNPNAILVLFILLGMYTGYACTKNGLDYPRIGKFVLLSYGLFSLVAIILTAIHLNSVYNSTAMKMPDTYSYYKPVNAGGLSTIIVVLAVIAGGTLILLLFGFVAFLLLALVSAFITKKFIVKK